MKPICPKCGHDDLDENLMCPKCGFTLQSVDIDSATDCAAIQEAFRKAHPTPPPTTFEQALAEVSRECDELMVRKQRDYGHANITTFGEFGVIVRINDKLQRIINLHNRGAKPENESLVDSYRDLRNYATILCMLARGTFTLPLEEDAK